MQLERPSSADSSILEAISQEDRPHVDHSIVSNFVADAEGDLTFRIENDRFGQRTRSTLGSIRQIVSVRVYRTQEIPYVNLLRMSKLRVSTLCVFSETFNQIAVSRIRLTIDSSARGNPTTSPSAFGSGDTRAVISRGDRCADNVVLEVTSVVNDIAETTPEIIKDQASGILSAVFRVK